MSAVWVSTVLAGPDVIAQPWASTTQGEILIPVIVSAIIALGTYLTRLIGKVLQQGREVKEVLDQNKTEVKDALALSDRAQERYRDEIRGRIGSIDQTVAAIQAEVKPNSGGSLKDAVGRIEEKLERHLTDSRYQQERLDSLFVPASESKTPQ